MSKAQELKDAAKRNIDTRTVVSVGVGLAVFGTLVYVVAKLGKHGKQLATVVKGGK